MHIKINPFDTATFGANTEFAIIEVEYLESEAGTIDYDSQLMRLEDISVVRRRPVDGMIMVVMESGDIYNVTNLQDSTIEIEGVVYTDPVLLRDRIGELAAKKPKYTP